VIRVIDVAICPDSGEGIVYGVTLEGYENVYIVRILKFPELDLFEAGDLMRSVGRGAGGEVVHLVGRIYRGERIEFPLEIDK